MASQDYAESYSTCAKRLDDAKTCLRWAKELLARDGLSNVEKVVAQEAIGNSFVIACSGIERFFRETVEFLVDSINADELACSQLKLSLHALISLEDFRSLQNTRKLGKVSRKRIDILNRTVEASQERLSLDYGELGIDGRTIRTEQIKEVWSIFGFSAPEFSSSQQATSFRILSSNRNDYAHGNVALEDFLENRECSPDSIRGRLSDIDDWIEHFFTTATDYIDLKQYKRL